MFTRMITVAVTIALISFASAQRAWGRDFLLVASYGNFIHVIDTEAQRVVASRKLPGPGTAPTAIVASADGRTAYAIVNAWSTLIGINLDTGAVVFRADLAQDGIRAVEFFGLEISPDGTELYVAEQRWRVLADRYEVVEPKIAVYSTRGGLQARAIRFLAAPRRTMGIGVSADGNTIYANSYDISVIDAQTGAVRKKLPFLNANLPGLSVPDMYNLWTTQNDARVFAHPFYVSPTERPEETDLGVVTVDYATGTLSTSVIEAPTSPAAMVVALVNPVRPNEIFGVGNYLYKIDRNTKRIVQRVLPSQYFYTIGISSDGSKIFTGGGICNIGIYATSDLHSMGLVKLPHCADQAMGAFRVIRRDSAAFTGTSLPGRDVATMR